MAKHGQNKHGQNKSAAPGFAGKPFCSWLLLSFVFCVQETLSRTEAPKGLQSHAEHAWVIKCAAFKSAPEGSLRVLWRIMNLSYTQKKKL